MTLAIVEKFSALEVNFMRLLIWLVPLLPLGLIGLVLFSGEEIALRSSGSTAVLSQFKEEAAPRPVIMVLQPGQRVTVVSCESNKSDVEIQVRLSSGQTGFVAGGDYRLERRRVSLGSLTSPGSIVFSCRGIFAPISEPYPK
jgi:hypothetical protein